MFLNISTFIFGGPPAAFSSVPRSSAVARCKPRCASVVANVRAKGLYGARIVPVCTGGGRGSEPSEFRWVFRYAFWRSVSAADVAFVAATSSGVTLTGGGGGDPVFPSDNRLGLSGDSKGDCGGDMICTRFFGFPVFVRGGAVHSCLSLLPNPSNLPPAHAYTLAQRRRCRLSRSHPVACSLEAGGRGCQTCW